MTFLSVYISFGVGMMDEEALYSICRRNLDIGRSVYFNEKPFARADHLLIDRISALH